MSWRASSGLRAWIVQRFSALYIAGFFLTSLVTVTIYPPHTYQQWVQLIAHPFVNIALGLFFLALLAHAWVGLRDVVLDYVKPLSIKVILLAVIILALASMALWALSLLIKVLN